MSEDSMERNGRAILKSENRKNLCQVLAKIWRKFVASEETIGSRRRETNENTNLLAL